MGDVADILGLSKSQSPSFQPLTTKKRSRPPPSTTTAKKKPQKKRSGLTREIAALTQGQGGGVNGVVPEPSLPQVPKGFKEKWNPGKKAERWVWRPFTSTSRTDGASFYHWSKLRDPIEDYRFAKLNKHKHIIPYDDADYKLHLTSADWSREETDYLFKMCRRFDCRFIVITDRWEKPKPRSVEDLKDRFYFVQRKMIELAGIRANDLNWKKHPLVKEPFNKEQEIYRKKQLECLFQRDKKQIEEEDQITPKATQILETFKKRKRENMKIVRIARKMLNLATTTSEKRGGGGGGRGKNSVSSAEINRLISKNPKFPFLINQTLDSLGISKPERNNKDSHFQQLKNAIVVLLELEKVQHGAQYQLMVLKEQRNLLVRERQRRSTVHTVDDSEPDTDEGNDSEVDGDPEAEDDEDSEEGPFQEEEKMLSDEDDDCDYVQ